MESDTSASVPTAMHVPKTVLGVERRLYHFNLAFGVLLFSIFRVWWILLVPVLGHLAGVLITTKYPDLVAVYLRYRRQATYYRPWGEPLARNRRPEGYGRAMAG